MGDSYQLHVSVDLCADISDDDLAVVRWIAGLGPRPVVVPELDRMPSLEPLVPEGGPVEPGADEVSGPGWLGVPGGQDVSLVHGIRYSDGRAGWSLAMRVLVHDDAFHHEGIADLVWLATVTDTEGVFAQARTQFNAFPGFTFLSSRRRAYLLDGPGLMSYTGSAPPPSEQVVRDLRTYTTSLADRS